MKNALSFGIVWLTLVSTSVIARMSKQGFETITAAIKISDLKKVENLLAFYILDEHEKKSLLEEATTVLLEKEQNVKLQNPRNSAKEIVVGTLLATYGSLAAIATGKTFYPAVEQMGFKGVLEGLTNDLLTKENYKAQFFCLSIPFGLLAGMYLINKGLSCATTVAVYNNTEKIREFIEKTQVD